MEAGTELSEGYCGGNRKSSSPLVEKTTALLAPWSATATRPFAINVVPYGDFREPGANSDATGLSRARVHREDPATTWIGNEESVRAGIKSKRGGRAETGYQNFRILACDRVLVDPATGDVGDVDLLSAFVEGHGAKLGCIFDARDELDVSSLQVHPVDLV